MNVQPGGYEQPLEGIPVNPNSPQATAMKYVNPHDHIVGGTSFHCMVGWVIYWSVIVVVAFATIVPTLGMALIGYLIALIVYLGYQKRLCAMLRGSAVQVGPEQFPEIYQSAQDLCQRLRLARMPDIYIFESNEQNAAALKTGSREALILTDDIVDGALGTGDPRVLDFVIGHELAHHALGHTGLLRRSMSTKWRPVVRLDEFTCDAVADALVESKQASATALALLAVGPQLLPRVNLRSLLQQTKEVVADKNSRKSEKTLTHPLLLRRYARICGIDVKC